MQHSWLPITSFIFIKSLSLIILIAFIQAETIDRRGDDILPNKGPELDAFKAIQSLHTKLDVDADGEVDDLESKRFLESEKNRASGGSDAQKLRYLHQDGKDKSISVDELWQSWKNSQVYNWTVEQTVYWLVNYVELPEYVELFEQKQVNGTVLPRLATDMQFMSKLGITEPSAKSKISIKAMDVVLFGPPKLAYPSKLRDIIVSIIIVIAVSACYIFYSRSRASQLALQAMKYNLDSIQKTVDQIPELQKELDKSLKAQQAVVTENGKNFRAPPRLKTLLRITYNIESQYYNEKKLSLESKATDVKLRNQKLQRKKTSFLGYYKIAQENSLEDDLNTIVEVKEAFQRVTNEIKERNDRWREIEELCGCSLDLISMQTKTSNLD